MIAGFSGPQNPIATNHGSKRRQGHYQSTTLINIS